MAQRKLLTNGNAFVRTDGRWAGVVWYMDEHGERKRKSFSGTTRGEVNRKMADYVAAFEKQLVESDESKKSLEESMANWLKVFKFPSIERGSYDRLECTAKHQIYPLLGGKVVGDVTSADIRKLLNHWMNEGYAYTTVKKVYNLLTDYFRYLTQQELIQKNPMTAVPMIKKANFLAAQGKENRPTCETVTTFTPEEIERFKAESYRTWSNGERVYQQAAAYTLGSRPQPINVRLRLRFLGAPCGGAVAGSVFAGRRRRSLFNTGLRTGEVLGLLNSDVDLDKKVLHLQRGVKEVSRRDGVEFTSGREVKIGKLKSASSKRDVPLNQAAVDAILDLRAERYFGEDTPLIPDENGDYTRPVNFRRRYYRILEAAGIEQKGLHSIRHPYVKHATTLFSIF